MACSIATAWLLLQRVNKFAPLYSDMQRKLLELTGIPLEPYPLTYHGDIDKGVANYNGIVKEIRIGQSASKYLVKDKGSTTDVGRN